MPVNRRSIERMADYILSQDCERESALDELKKFIVMHRRFGGEQPNRSIQRKHIQESIWYIAYRAMYGAKEAMKAITELLDEV